MKYLITGITGTLGQAVSRILLEDDKNEIVGVSRDEQKQRSLPSHPRLTLRLGDIRDVNRLMELSRGVDVLFHFAALKCVDTLEYEPDECVRTNVIGTMNVISAQRANSIPRVVLSATDKGVYPVNAYGNSKALAERLVLQNSNNIVCRYGNVVASRGSVVPAFVRTLRSERRVYITHLEMTRFLINIEDAAKFVVDSSNELTGGLKIPKMKSARITDVADTVAAILGIGSFGVNVIGVRPGEKIHENLMTQFEGMNIDSSSCDQFSAAELTELLSQAVKSA